MALTVENGTVVTGANSYVTLAYANAYFEVDAEFFDTWDALDDEDKEIRLKWATRILDQKVVWKGRKTTDASPLRWPRTGVQDRDGISVGINAIPEQLKQVTCEMAKFVGTVNPTTSQGGDALKRVVVDVIELEYQDGAIQAEAPPLFNQLLTGLGFYPTSGGHSFARIIKA
jgi:hypothetical protein